MYSTAIKLNLIYDLVLVFVLAPQWSLKQTINLNESQFDSIYTVYCELKLIET